MAAEKQVAQEIQVAREIGCMLGVEMEPFVEHFVPLPKPYVRLFGAAANAAGRPLANVVKLSASKDRYIVVVELPQVQFSDNKVEWTVNCNGEVTIEGKITPAAIFEDKPITGIKRNRVQRCLTEPWAISFYFPGPVDWRTTWVMFCPDNLMEMIVMKRNPGAETSGSGSKNLVPVSNTTAPGSSFVLMARVSAIGSTPVVPPVAETSASGLTAFVSVTETSASGSARPMAGVSVSGLTSFIPLSWSRPTR